MIENGFFPVSSDLPGLTFTARMTDDPNTKSVIIGDLSSQVPISPGGRRMVFTFGNIACKGEGRPKAEITWSAVDSSMVVVPINTSNIIVPREGRSILRVEFDPTDTRNITYTCTATNECGERPATVRVDPIGMCISSTLQLTLQCLR